MAIPNIVGYRICFNNYLAQILITGKKEFYY